MVFSRLAVLWAGAFLSVHTMALSVRAAQEQLIPDSVFPNLKQSLIQMHCTFKSPIRKWQIALNTYKINPS